MANPAPCGDSSSWFPPPPPHPPSSGPLQQASTHPATRPPSPHLLSPPAGPPGRLPRSWYPLAPRCGNLGRTGPGHHGAGTAGRGAWPEREGRPAGWAPSAEALGEVWPWRCSDTGQERPEEVSKATALKTRSFEGPQAGAHRNAPPARSGDVLGPPSCGLWDLGSPSPSVCSTKPRRSRFRGPQPLPRSAILRAVSLSTVSLPLWPRDPSWPG